MRVAFISQHFDSVLPPDQNSLGIWTYEVSRRLAGENEVTVISRRSREQPARAEIDGATMELLTCLPQGVWGKASKLWDRTFPRTPLFTKSFYALDYLVQAVRKIRLLQPDVIHLQNFPNYAPVFRRAAPNAAIVLHMHCNWLSELDHDAMARCLKATDLVVGCSGHVVDAARDRFPDSQAQFSVLPNGAPDIRRDLPATAREPGKVLFVGRLSPEKGLHTLLEAWPRVIAACPEARLELVGANGETAREFLIDLSDDPDVRELSRFYRGGSAHRGTYLAALQEMIAPEFGHTVTFAGGQPYERVVERYAGASLVVNPSLSESFGMSLVEALMHGTPVVATRVGGMTEIIEATGGGTLVGKNDPDALSDAMIAYLQNPETCREVGIRGAERASDLYSWARIARLTHDIHREARSLRQSRNAIRHRVPPVHDGRKAGNTAASENLAD
ncbi:glycosyltransferase family 4 protein [Oricola nitratireducens]|uniref:glycosyltransferase family 4 protein n=1 Tax=Oricola nitratireducens TaxID=2775868 RepID=UPI001869457B|nr:glycosyltransferase family 4 protein [Oricola nitratireducens]